ncbi:rhodanese-like domain-containing protein [Geothrix terrae]|uniref:rhodanese-like domain-containing protein n=1 Tax=Geothrix terrae TaxID=2922720 RepID=UPI003B845C52
MAAGFLAKLTHATDPSDVAVDLENGVNGFIVVDARTPEAYSGGHIPGAINFPHRTMNAASTAHLSKELVYVTYCDGIGCNASTKAAYKLASMGFKVKEMLGGLDWWIRDGYAVEVGAKPARVLGAGIRCGC